MVLASEIQNVPGAEIQLGRDLGATRGRGKFKSRDLFLLTFFLPLLAVVGNAAESLQHKSHSRHLFIL